MKAEREPGEVMSELGRPGEIHIGPFKSIEDVADYLGKHSGQEWSSCRIERASDGHRYLVVTKILESNADKEKEIPQSQSVYNAHPVDRMPEGYEEVEVEMVCCHPETGHVVIFGRPIDEEKCEDWESAHSCDEMGCGSVGSHVLMTCTIAQPWSLSYHANPKDRRVFKL